MNNPETHATLGIRQRRNKTTNVTLKSRNMNKEI
jgi:hypothetical protein